MLELENLFNNKTMDCGTRFDGKTISPMFQFANVVNDKPINDTYGRTVVNTIVENPKHKSTFEKYGIYDFTTKRKVIVHAFTYPGLKELLYHLKGPFADNYRAYCIDTTTRVEAGDSSMKDVIDANAASSNVLNQMARDALPDLAPSSGPSFAAPRHLVRGNRAFDVRSCLCLCCYAFVTWC